MKVFSTRSNAINLTSKSSHVAHAFIRLVKQGVFRLAFFAFVLFASSCVATPSKAQNTAVIKHQESDQATLTSTSWALQGYQTVPWIIRFSGSQVASSSQSNGWSCSASGLIYVPAAASTGSYTASVKTGNTRSSPMMPTMIEEEIKNFTFNVVKLVLSVPANVMAGQSVTVSANVDGKPTGATETGKQWTIGGTKIKEFKQTVWTPPNPNANPPVSEIKPSGQKVELSASDLQNTSVGFYFINGSLNGTTENVSYSVSVNGKQLSANGTIKVFRPQMNSFTSTWTNSIPAWGIRYGALMLGDYAGDYGKTPGITWNVEVQTPANGAGNIAFVQLIAMNRSLSYANSTKTANSGGQYVLDADETSNMIYNSTSIGSGVTLLWNTPDSPGNVLAGTLSSSFNDSFQTYLMYQPANGIWVTLGKLSWSASASSTYNATTGQQQVNAGATPAVGGAGPTGSNSTELPSWNDSLYALSKRSGF